MRLGIVLCVSLLLLLSGPVLPARAEGATKDLVSGVLEGRRASYLTCELINKSGGPLANVQLTLEAPDGSAIVGPLACPELANGETCALEHEIPFAMLELAAYCHAELPKAFVRGSLRLLDAQRNTLAESDLEADLHGKIASLESQLETVLGLFAPTLVVAFIDDDSNDLFDENDRLIAKIVDANLDNVPSDGDLLVTERYPLDFGVLASGVLRAGPIRCDTITGPQSGEVTCTSDRLATSFRFISKPGDEEAFRTDPNSLVLLDDHGGGGDYDSIQSSVASPLMPNIHVSLTKVPPPSPVDNDFLDVDFSP